jgi:hypothetical protein
VTNQPGGPAATGPEPVVGAAVMDANASPAVAPPPAVTTVENPAVSGESRMRRLIARFKVARKSAANEGGTANGTRPPLGAGNGESSTSSSGAAASGSGFRATAAAPERRNSEQRADRRRTARGGRSRPQNVTDTAPPENVLGWAGGPRRGSGRANPQGSGSDARSTSTQRGEARAGRQRNLSARVGAERAKAARETAARRRSTSAAAADLLWTRLPEKPTRYHLVTRFSDMGHGWLDGKSGLPRLPELPKPMPLGESAAPIHEAHARPFPAPTALPAVAISNARPTVTVEPSPAPALPATSPAWLQTPRMVLLGRRALELIRAEEQACVADCAAYRRGISRFRMLRDAAEEDLNQARAALALAQRPLTEHELSARRLAEQSTQDRPESLVRGRRQTQWDRRLTIATQAVKVATAQLADATREAEFREELIRDRMAVARAAALRHHEFHMRRIATYLQQLVRTHKQGADLNMLLMHYAVGPDLPEWTTNPHTSDGASCQ